MAARRARGRASAHLPLRTSSIPYRAGRGASALSARGVRGCARGRAGTVVPEHPEDSIVEARAAARDTPVGRPATPSA
eukprot:6518228-Alexandrium_andersonii.AAC.1